MRPLLGCWMDVAGRIRGAASIVLFTDFDGTLAPLVARPEDARITGATRAALARPASAPSDGIAGPNSFPRRRCGGFAGPGWKSPRG